MTDADYLAGWILIGGWVFGLVSCGIAGLCRRIPYAGRYLGGGFAFVIIIGSVVNVISALAGGHLGLSIAHGFFTYTYIMGTAVALAWGDRQLS